MKRFEKAFKNTKYAMASQLLTTFVSFINRTVFIHYLSVEYLGINGLFDNILSILSLAELGVGSAITYNMYHPLATNDVSRVKRLMNFYRMMYNIIGTFVFAAGLGLMPFLGLLINNKPNIGNLELIYVLYVVNSASSYFFTYKRSILFADQKNYIDSINKCQQSIVQSIVQNTVLIMTHNFIAYYLTQILSIVLFNFIISKKANRMYSYLRNNHEKLEPDETRKILKDVSALLMHRIGYVVVCSTDNFLISKFISIAAVGLYSNYLMILSAVKGVIMQIITGISASVGNLNAMESREKSYEVFKRIYFLNAWLIGFCSIAFYILFNPFIELWIGKDYLLPPSIVLIISVNFYICDTRGIRSVVNTFKDSMGLFWQDRFKPIFEASINLVASILLLKAFGLSGVLLGTLFSTVVTDIWVEPYILFKHGFKRKLVSYFEMFLKYGFLTLAAGFITKSVCSWLSGSPTVTFLMSMLIVTIIPNLIFLMVYYNTEECRYFIGLLMNKIIRKELSHNVWK